MTEVQWLYAITGVAALTYLLRAAPLLWRRLRIIGERNVAFLSYVSFAIAAGIVSKAVLIDAGRWAAPDDVIVKGLAVLAAIGLHRFFHRLPVALFGGVGVAVVLKGGGGFEAVSGLLVPAIRDILHAM
ncbi:MAG: AzlD domain-containing protein [Gammaproteobacteria bacterium]|nr:AzlD domain-containing protein [Gammaproteobacteria bacterium]